MKKLILKVKLLLIGIFSNERAFEAFLASHVSDAINIVTAIHTALTSLVLTAAASLLPPNLQALEVAAKNKVLDILDQVAKDILEGQDILNMTAEQRFQALLKYLKTLSPAMLEGASLKIASRYAMYSLNDPKATPAVVDTAVQNQFFETTQKAAA